MGRFGDDLTNVFPGFSQNGTLGSTGLGNLTPNCGRKVNFVSYAIRKYTSPPQQNYPPELLPSRKYLKRQLIIC